MEREIVSKDLSTLLNLCYPSSKVQAYLAVNYRNLSILERLQGKYNIWVTSLKAVECNNLPALRFLLRGGQGKDIGDYAARKGKKEILDWAISEGYQLSEETFIQAAGSRSLEMVNHLFSLGCPRDWRAANKAASKGSIEILERMRERGNFPINRTSLLSSAACKGRIEVLKWAFALGYPRLNWLTSCAARGGQVETIEWLLEEGFPWHEETVIAASLFKHPKVLDYAKSKGYPCDSAIYFTAITCDEDLLDIYNRPEEVKKTLTILEWGKRNGLPIEERAYQAAKERRSPEILSWLERNFPRG